MTLHPVLYRFLIVSAKHAINAVLVNSALMLQWHSIFNFDNLPGVWAVARATMSVVAAREALVWGPILLKWTNTDADPSEPVKQALDHAATANKEAGAAIADAKAAVPEKP